MVRTPSFRSPVSHAVSLAILGMTSAAPAAAQDQRQEARETVEEIVVTGSRIPRRDFTSPSPMTTVDQLELRLAGVTNVEDTLNTLPQVVPDLGRATNNPGNGTATVNLRGLGTNRSLVLLNGRRFIPTDTFGSVDLNNIPSALIERIEVVSGGASAVYGSDALTGAVNFILRQDFDGIEATVQYDVTERGDGDVIDLNLAAGTQFAGGRGNVSGFLNYYDRSSIFARDRAFTQQTIFDDIFTGETFPAGSSAVPAGIINSPADIGGVPAPDGITFEPDGTPRPFVDPDDRFNYAPFNYIQVPLERKVAAAFLNFDISATARLYGEYMFVDSVQASELAPTANFFAQIQMNLDNPFVAPETRQIFEDFFDPDDDGIAEFFFSKRLPELGSRNLRRDTELNRLVAGFDADIWNDWSFDVHLVLADSDGQVVQSNDGSRSRFLQAMLVDPVTMECFDPSGGCVPANIFGENSISPEAADFIRAPPFTFDLNVNQTIVGSSIVGTLAELPAGDLGFALGIEYREDEYEEIPDPDVDNDDQMGLFIDDPMFGKTELTEVFGEVRVPILSDKPFARYLAVEGGYRYSDHDIAGGFDTWKAALEWEPFTGYTLRGSMQQAVRAPNALEYFEIESSFVDPFIAEFGDLCSASLMPDQLGITDVCIAQGIPASQVGVFEATPFFPTLATTSGNLDLDPEESDTLTAGIVMQPEFLPDFQLSVDYYSIEIENAIQFVEPFDTVILCFTVNNPDDPLCQAVERDPVTFNISAVAGGPRNVAKIRTEGFDVQINYEHDLPTWLAMFDGNAYLRWWFVGNHAIENGTQTTPDVEFTDCAGNIGFPCDVNSFGTLPENKTKTRVTYVSGPLSLSLQWRWVDGMNDAFLEHGLELFGIPRDSVNFAIPYVGSENYYALSFDYLISDSIELFGGIHNLTDNDPPLLAGNQSQSNTDPSLYDVYGRRYYLGVTARFGS
jgi:outer membrane receptor protein involved in Fe transport